MTHKTFYVKEGRKYIPISEYDSELRNAYQHGTHIVISKSGQRLTKYNIEPEFAPLIAAGTFAVDRIAEVLVKASDLRPRRKPITVEQKEAWEKLSASFGDDIHLLEWPSAREAADVAVTELITESQKMMTHPAVKAAYEQFLVTCKLCR